MLMVLAPHRIIASLLTGTVCLMLLTLAGPLILWPVPPEPKVGLEYFLQGLTGGVALDCGRLEPSATAVEMQSGLECALRAARWGRPFRLIKSEYGTDSWVPHGLAKGRVGPVMRFSYDSMGGFDSSPCVSPVVTTKQIQLPFGRPGVTIRSYTCAK